MKAELLYKALEEQFQPYFYVSEEAE